MLLTWQPRQVYVDWNCKEIELIDGRLRWVSHFLLRSARAHGTSTLAQSNGPHIARVMKLSVTKVAANKLNIFSTLLGTK